MVGGPVSGPQAQSFGGFGQVVGDRWLMTGGQYAIRIACLAVAGSSSTASMRWATSALEIA